MSAKLTYIIQYAKLSSRPVKEINIIQYGTLSSHLVKEINIIQYGTLSSRPVKEMNMIDDYYVCINKLKYYDTTQFQHGQTEIYTN